MGRHRSDPFGAARLVIVIMVAVGVLGLLVVGVLALVNPTTEASSVPIRVTPSPTPTPEADTKTPTLEIVCVAERCPVFVRVPGGDILTDQELTQGQRVRHFEPELDVVLDDAGTVQVEENGKARPPGAAGEREAFEVRRAPDQPS
ncbi:hypothetical protein GCM10009555_015520 [Acrocarpospora macrocephala]|uniref:DUF4115 domain-containing protein n=1 Tax=Acrocarpospora macrocephala TaxID=150177 RepID=A0A5M3X5N8_9ACTN|nr:hypothetical protein [Acrocarpospora macrocephala]GES14193.1 hypothetical protein Amac_077900 [Acrocarpospora macrocephala]